MVDQAERGAIRPMQQGLTVADAHRSKGWFLSPVDPAEFVIARHL
jgi:hypothetical protein